MTMSEISNHLSATAGEDVLELHRELVSIPSLSGEESEVASHLELHFRSAGLSPRRIGDNIIVSIGEGSNTLLLNSHLDVVPPSADHPYPPFEPTLVDGQIFGRGSVDAKASVASMATAVCRLFADRFTPFEGKIFAAFTTCEERGGFDNGLEQILPELPALSAALIGEPTHMQPCIAQKGLLILRLVARGTSAHAARAEEGDNAIDRMARDLALLSGFSFDKVHPHLGETSLSVTMIEGGTARNVIPDSCTAFVDIRSTPSYTHDEIAAILDDLLESEVHIHSERFVPTDTPEGAAIVQACLNGNPNSKAFGSPTMSDWIHVKDIPAVKIGPGDSRLSHTAQEHISSDELVQSPAIYESIIVNYFQQKHA